MKVGFVEENHANPGLSKPVWRRSDSLARWYVAINKTGIAGTIRTVIIINSKTGRNWNSKISWKYSKSKRWSSAWAKNPGECTTSTGKNKKVQDLQFQISQTNSEIIRIIYDLHGLSEGGKLRLWRRGWGEDNDNTDNKGLKPLVYGMNIYAILPLCGFGFSKIIW